MGHMSSGGCQRKCMTQECLSRMVLSSTAVAGNRRGPRACDNGHQSSLPRDQRFKSDICAKEAFTFNSTLRPKRINQIPLLCEILVCACRMLLSFSKISTLSPHVT